MQTSLPRVVHAQERRHGEGGGAVSFASFFSFFFCLLVSSAVGHFHAEVYYSIFINVGEIS